MGIIIIISRLQCPQAIIRRHEICCRRYLVYPTISQIAYRPIIIKLNIVILTIANNRGRVYLFKSIGHGSKLLCRLCLCLLYVGKCENTEQECCLE